MLRFMGEIRVGTASWIDRTLLASGWYPPEADTPDKRLRFYASQFPLVEVDTTYYALPAEQTAAAWAERAPDGFTFNIKAFSLFTQHPTRVAALPADLREAAGTSGRERVYLKDVDPGVAEEAWDRFLAALEPLRGAGKLGAILLQFPPWFPMSGARKDYILSCAQRVAPRQVCIEFRNSTWMTEDNRAETLEFLAANKLPYVCVDMPQGYKDSVPPVLAATADLAVLRLHGQLRQLDQQGQPGTVPLRLQRRGAQGVGAENQRPRRGRPGHARAVQQLLRGQRPAERAAAGQPPGSLTNALESSPAATHGRGQLVTSVP